MRIGRRLPPDRFPKIRGAVGKWRSKYKKQAGAGRKAKAILLARTYIVFALL